MFVSKFLKWILVSVAVVVLTACGGGGSGGDAPSTQEVALGVISQYAEDGRVVPMLQTYNDAGITDVTANNIAVINTLVEALDIKDVNTPEQIQALVDRYIASLIPEDNKAIIEINTLGLEIESMTGYTLSSSNLQVEVGKTDLNISKEKQDVIALIDEGGQPVLIGRKYAGEEKIDISLASSAEMFILYAPRFNGVQVSDAKELSSRIRNHQDFTKLIEAVKYAIDTKNPCPLDPICNYQAKEVALKIAGELELDDLYQEGAK